MIDMATNKYELWMSAEELQLLNTAMQIARRAWLEGYNKCEQPAKENFQHLIENTHRLQSMIDMQANPAKYGL